MTRLRKFLEYTELQAIVQDTEFKISKPHPEEKLLQSIVSVGILQPVILFREDSKYRILAGHNRIKIALEKGIRSVPAIIYDECNINDFIEHALIKGYHNEIGPLGKLNALLIITRYLSGQEYANTLEKLKIGLRLPDFIINSQENVARISTYPESLQYYLDMRDIQFKVIKKLLQLPEEGIHCLSQWLESILMRVNIFKEIIQAMIDIFARDATFKELAAIDIHELSPKEQEKYLYQKIYSIRYPRYSALKEKSLLLAKEFQKDGIDVQFPAYFEGNSIDIMIKAKKSDNGQSFFKALSVCDKQKIEHLLDIV